MHLLHALKDGFGVQNGVRKGGCGILRAIGREGGGQALQDGMGVVVVGEAYLNVDGRVHMLILLPAIGGGHCGYSSERFCVRTHDLLSWEIAGREKSQAAFWL